jgi:hypothetical protein
MPKKTGLAFDPLSYAPVADRITLFYERHPSGRINTELVSRDDGTITFKALVYRELGDAFPAATGWASEREGDGDVNAVACLENAETSAIGRALANLGFTASTRRPSREEMEKVDRVRQRHSAAVSIAGSAEHGDRQAIVVHELLQLLATARRAGFPERRSGVIAAHVNRAPGLPLPQMRRLERRVRTWLRARGM